MNERDLSPNFISTTVRFNDVLKNVHAYSIEGIKIYLKTISLVSPKLAAKKALEIFCTPLGPNTKAIKRKSIFNDAFIRNHSIEDNIIKSYVFNPDGEKQVLLAHGWNGQARDFRSLIETLISYDYKVVTFDGPAHGLSEGKTTNMIEFSKVIATIAMEHGEFDAFIGHSFGGGAVLMAIQNHDVDVKKVVTISSPNKMTKVLKNYAKHLDLDENIQKEMVDIFQRDYDIDFRSISLEEMFEKIGKEGLVIHDTNDRIVTHDAAFEILERNPDLKLIQTDALGHSKLLKEPYVHQNILDFLFC